MTEPAARVLIVDDDPALCRTMGDILKVKGFVPKSFNQGKPAIAWAEHETPVVALIDLRLEDLPGLQVMKAIKDVSPRTECIVLTGHASQASAIEAVNLGAYSYFRKPFDIDQILLAIRRIVEKHETAAALLESEQRFRRLADNAQDIIYRYEFTPERRFSYVSPAATTITGYTPEEHYANPDLWLKLAHPDDLPLLERYFQGQGTFRDPLTMRWICKDDSVSWIEQRNKPIYDGAGILIAVEGIARDITERKQAEDALKESEEIHRITLQNILDLVFLTDDDGRFTFICSNVLQILGYTLDEIQAMGTISELLGEDLFSLEDLKARGEIYNIETAIVDKHGRKRDFLSTVKSVSIRGGTILYTFHDITERKWAQAALGESEERFRIAAESASDLIWEWDILSGKLEWFGAVDAFLGYAPGEFPRTLEAWEKIIHPDDHDHVMAVLDLHLKARMPYAEEYRVRRKDGTSGIWTDRGSAVWDEKGNAYKMIGVCTDITARKRAEEALTAERALLRTLVDHLPDTVYVKDGACRKTLANPADVRYMGASSEAEVLGKTDFDFYPHDLATAFYADDQSVLQSGQPMLNREEVITRPDGTRGWQLTSKVALRDSAGQVVGLVGIGHDITNRIRAEQELRQSEERFRALFHGVPAACWTYDRAGMILDWNQACEDIYGWSAEQAVGKTMYDLMIREENVERTAQVITAVFEGQAFYEQEYEDRRADGSTCYVLTNEYPLRDATGRVVMGICAQLDITERKQTEEALCHYTAQLEALRQVSLELATELDLDTLLRSIVERATALVGGRWGSFEIYRPDLDALMSTAMIGAGPDLSGIPLLRGEGLAGKVWASGEPLIVEDYEHWEGQAPAYASYPLRAMVGVPVHWGDQFLGVLNIEGKTVGAFSPTDAELLGLFAAQAAIAIHNARLFEAERAAREQAEKLKAATQALSATLDLQQVFERILTELRYVVPYDSASVQELTENRLEIIGGHGFPNLEELLGASFDLSAQDNPNREVVYTRGPLVLDDAPTHYEGFSREPHAQVGTRAWLGVPLLFGDRVIGLIALDKREPGFYREEHARLAMAFASQAAVAIENARLYRQAVLAAERRAVLHRASQEIIRALHDPEQVYQAVHRAAAQLMPAEAFVIVLRDDARDQNEAVYLFDKGGRWPARHMPAEQGLSGQVIATGRSLLIEDFSTGTMPEAILFGEPEPVRCILAVPLRLGEKVMGMISAQSYQPGAYSLDDQALLEMLAAHAAAALENVRLFDEAQRHNRELTLLNRVIAASAAGRAVEQILETVCRELALAFDVPQSAAALFNDERTEAVVVAEYLAPGRPPAIGEIIPVVDNPGSQHLLKYKTPLVIDDAQTDPRQAPIHDLMRRRGTVSLLLLPLIVAGQVVGSLGVDAMERRAFSTEELGLAQRVAEQVSGVLARARLEEERQKLEDQFLQAQKLEAVGRLAGGIAHDFNNLLTVIHLSSRLLEQELWPEDPLSEHVQRIQDAGQRATNLTRQLLAFSRREIVEPHLLDLNDVVANLDKMLRRLIGEDVELITILAQDLWTIKIDPSQMDQVILNLVVNARDAMPMGGSLTIETANLVLDSAYTARRLGVEPGEYVMLAVSDSGGGMDEEVKAHLFEPFFTTKEAGKGTGLGLATVHGIVKQNNGHIWVYSEPGQGTTFKIYLPHISKGTRAPSDLPAPGMGARGDETVLLVEDETDVRELMQDILVTQGYQVLTAKDGVDALQVARQYDGPIHLLLTDVVMPRLSGRELAEELRSSRPTMRVLYTSGYTDNAMMRFGVLAEDIHFLSKPFELEALARKVRDVLDSAT